MKRMNPIPYEYSLFINRKMSVYVTEFWILIFNMVVNAAHLRYQYCKID